MYKRQGGGHFTEICSFRIFPFQGKKWKNGPKRIWQRCMPRASGGLAIRESHNVTCLNRYFIEKEFHRCHSWVRSLQRCLHWMLSTDKYSGGVHLEFRGGVLLVSLAREFLHKPHSSTKSLHTSLCASLYSCCNFMSGY